MAIPRTLNDTVDWLRVLPQLGVTPRSSVLPTVTGCPLCGGDRLYVFQDTLLGGEWHHCRGCGYAGDTIHLAAAVWKVDPVAAAERLVGTVGPDRPDLYRKLIAKNTRLQTMVDKARNAESTRLRPILQQLCLTYYGDYDRWKDRLGRFVGVASRDEVILGCRSSLDVERGYTRIFPDTGWGELLIVPFHDLPDRVRGIWMIGRNMTPKDVIFESTDIWNSGVDAQGQPRNYRSESGLGFLEAITGPPDPEFGDTIFILDDTLAAVKIHDRQFRQSSRVLPLACCHPKGSLWANLDNGVLAGKRPVFWGMKLNIDLIRQAKFVDGSVASADTVTESPYRYIARFAPRVWLTHLKETALPWPLALEKFIANKPDLEVESTLAAMVWTGDERQRFEAACSRDTRERLDRVHGQGIRRTVRIGDSVVREENGAWYHQSSRPWERNLVTDAPFRIQQIVRGPRPNETHLRVVATYRNRDVVFMTSSAAFEKSPLMVVRDKVMQAGLGMPADSTNWAKRVLAIATLFRPAEETVDAASRYGWDERRGAWVFERFELRSDGRISHRPDVAVPGDSRPTQSLTEPTGMHPDHVSALSKNDMLTAVSWATATCVLANLIAPVANRTTCGIAMAGPGASFAGLAAARHLGCAEHRAFGASDYAVGDGRGTGDTITKREREHGWPIALHRIRNYRGHLTPKWMSIPEPHNAILAVEPGDAGVLAAAGGWHTVECGQEFLSAEPIREALGHVVPEFLRWFGSTGMQLPARSTYGESILASVAAWFKEIGGNDRVLVAAEHLARFDHGGRTTPHIRRLTALIARAVDTPKSGVTLVPGTRGGQFLAAVPFLDFTKSQKAVPLEPTALSVALTTENALLSERGPNGESGWEIPTSWWARKYGSWRRHYCRLGYTGDNS